MYKATNVDTDKALEYLNQVRRFEIERCNEEVNKRTSYRDGLLEGIRIAESVFSCRNYEKE